MSVAAASQQSPPEVFASGLARAFGRHRAVTNATFVAPAGKVTAFVGPNGAGKTTTLKMVCGLIRPTSGAVSIGGRPVEGGPDTIACRMRALVERPAFYQSLSGFENLLLLARLVDHVTADQVDHALAAFGLADARNRPVGTYSTGMAQRLALAFCSLGAPSLVVLDEPTTGLDPEWRVQVRDALKAMKAAGRTTVIVSSHLLFEVQEVCDHMVMIRDGQVVMQGAIAGLLAAQAGSRFLVRATPRREAMDILSRRGVRESGEYLSFEADREAVPGIVNELVGRGVSLYELREDSPTLEDLYMRAASPEATR